MGKQVGPTPITAKLKRTTKGGIVQPQLKTLQSPAKKETRLTGRQIQERNARLTAERKAARQQKSSKTTQLKPGQTGYYRQEKRKGRDAASIRKENYAAAKGTSTSASSSNNSLRKEDFPSPFAPPKVDPSLKAPSSPRKQTKKITTTKKKVKTVTQSPTAPKEIKITTKSETSAKASKLRAKGEKALAEGKTEKAGRLRKRYDRKTKRDKRKAERKEKRSIRKNEISKLLQ